MIRGDRGSLSDTLYCRVCGKSQHDVRKVIAGPTFVVCNECIEVFAGMLREEDASSK
ncbi:ClpX C4-type zinc finger protein [Candidatus Phyllobacterium onerii]|uniref:ClpX C4-type zinc finger protein n=1 Tax=Candidatus Phyllobacterium onerii TaxID=3020828 RepID=UPI003A8BC93E